MQMRSPWKTLSLTVLSPVLALNKSRLRKVTTIAKWWTSKSKLLYSLNTAPSTTCLIKSRPQPCSSRAGKTSFMRILHRNRALRNRFRSRRLTRKDSICCRCSLVTMERSEDNASKIVVRMFNSIVKPGRPFQRQKIAWRKASNRSRIAPTPQADKNMPLRLRLSKLWVLLPSYIND